MDFGRESGNQAAAEQLVYDYRRANLSDDDVALCEYAVKLTLTPGAMGREDVQRLRDRGFEDASITVATQVIGYFNYINRVADGLGGRRRGVDDDPARPVARRAGEGLPRADARPRSLSRPRHELG
jgi:uncharacterized peroxidase-related enzyme